MTEFDSSQALFSWYTLAADYFGDFCEALSTIAYLNLLQTGVIFQCFTCFCQDPHYYGPAPLPEALQDCHMLVWKNVDSFMENSFYNLCLPQMVSTEIS